MAWAWPRCFTSQDVIGVFSHRAGAAAQVELMRDKLERRLCVPLTSLLGQAADQPISVAAAVGAAFHLEHGDSVERLLKHADKGMYRD